MPCPVCDWIKEVLNRPRAPPLFREEQFATAIPRALGFDVREQAWHESDPTFNEVMGTHKAVRKVKRKLTSKQKRRSNKMSRAMSKVNKKARKKDGSLKKGWSQSRIMKEAHKEVERMK